MTTRRITYRSLGPVSSSQNIDHLKEAASDMQSRRQWLRCFKFLRQRCWWLVNRNWETAYTVQMAANGPFPYASRLFIRCYDNSPC